MIASGVQLLRLRHLRPLRPLRPLERHLRRFLGSGSGSEVFPWLTQSEDLGGEVVGEPADVGVVFADDGVVILPSYRNAVLGSFELVLKLTEVFTGAELGIVLRYRQQSSQTLAQLL